MQMNAYKSEIQPSLNPKRGRYESAQCRTMSRSAGARHTHLIVPHHLGGNIGAIGAEAFVRAGEIVAQADPVAVSHAFVLIIDALAAGGASIFSLDQCGAFARGAIIYRTVFAGVPGTDKGVDAVNVVGRPFHQFGKIEIGTATAAPSCTSFAASICATSSLPHSLHFNVTPASDGEYQSIDA
jgi:hypothetical protein